MRGRDMKNRNLSPSLAAAAPKPVQFNIGDLTNLIGAARRALPGLAGADLVNVCGSIQRVEAELSAMQTEKPATDGADKKAVP